MKRLSLWWRSGLKQPLTYSLPNDCESGYPFELRKWTQTTRNYNAGCLVPLDPKAGVWPTETCEVMRQIEKAFWYAFPLTSFCYQKTRSNRYYEYALSSLNCKSAFKNIGKLRPSLLTPLEFHECVLTVVRWLRNSMSQVGTTQGDPLAMAMYVLALPSLMKLIK